MPCKPPHPLPHGHLCRVHGSPLVACNSWEFHSISSGKQMNGLDHPARLQTWDTSSVKSLFFLLFSQEGESKDMQSQILSQTEPCIPRATLTCLGYSELRCHDTALGLTTWWWSSTKQTRPLCMRAASCKSYCRCLPLRLKGKLCVYSHICDVHYFRITVEIFYQSTQSQYFSHHSSKISTAVNQRRIVSNSDCSLQCSIFSVLTFLPLLYRILLPPFCYFQLAFSHKCFHF